MHTKTILITGAGGSIGSEIARQIAKKAPKLLLLLDIYENNVYELQQELKRLHPEIETKILIASIRDEARIYRIFKTYKPHIVYHAAAHKHVPLMEENPGEAIKNNVFGTYHLVQAANLTETEKFVLISSDKAVNPTNIMGASKRICEILIQLYDKKSKTEYVAVRFGNVYRSSGSVVPLFEQQIKAGGPVEVTHPDIIRYFMTISEAVNLVLDAGTYAKGGEIFVLDMGKPVKILDLARETIRKAGYKEEEIGIVYTGLRPGEKLYEELLLTEEGMEKTPNQKIFVGKPVDVNEEEFWDHLKNLKWATENDDENLREYIKKIVPIHKEK